MFFHALHLSSAILHSQLDDAEKAEMNTEHPLKNSVLPASLAKIYIKTPFIRQSQQR